MLHILPWILANVLFLLYDVHLVLQTFEFAL